MWSIIILSVVVVGIFFLALAVRLLFGRRDGFRGTCASQNAALLSKGFVQGDICGVCGKKVEETGCNREEK